MVRSFSLLLLLVAQARARFDRYAGYTPVTQITDKAAIDLDQLEFNELLYNREIQKAKDVYERGGHSGAFAELTLKDMGDTKSYPAGTGVFGLNKDGLMVLGNLMEEVSWSSSDTEATIKVVYETEDLQAVYTDCQVGGLTEIQKANKDGCFTDDAGSLITFVQSESESVQYSYVYKRGIRPDNQNWRTLQSMSLTAADRMKGANDEYFDEYGHFVNYYGDSSYANKWIMAAKAMTSTDFSTGRGNSDFSILVDRRGQGEAMKKASAYLIIWMEVLHEMYQAVTQCEAGTPDAVHHVDSAVAFYTGSKILDSDEGILLYALAEVRAHQSKTAGHLDNTDSGDAFVNVQIFRQFHQMQQNVGAGSCAEARANMDFIAKMMKVPLIQGVLRYAHIRDFNLPELDEDRERAKAEGAVFAAAVLPLVHECGSREAEIIHDNMRVESDDSKFSFTAVRDALSRQYACMGVTCEHIGGIWNGGDWEEEGKPCGVSSDDGLSIGGVFGIVIGVALAGWVFIRYRHKIVVGKEKKRGSDIYAGNIAAVSEIS